MAIKLNIWNSLPCGLCSSPMEPSTRDNGALPLKDTEKANSSDKTAPFMKDGGKMVKETGLGDLLK